MKLSGSDTSKCAQTDVAHLFEDKVLLIGETQGHFLIGVPVFLRSLGRVDNLVWYARVPSVDAESLIKLPFVVLLGAKW